MKKVLLGAAMAVAMSVGGGSVAQASTYLLNVDNCSGGCGSTNYGSIFVTGEGTNTLSVDIELNSNVIFQQAGGGPGGHDEVWWSLNESSTTIAGLSDPFIPNGLQAAGSHDANGNSFGTWDYVIQYKPGEGNPADATGGVHSLLFTLTGTNPILDFNTIGLNNLYWVVDVAGYSADGKTLINTGRVGATLCVTRECGHEGGGGGEVPEPATWAMMLMGFGGLGAMLRRNRRQAALA